MIQTREANQRGNASPDGAAVSNEDAIEIKADTNSEIMLFDLP